MQVALLGGTGDIGEGLALRWAFHADHTILVGSRDAERARESAAAYEDTLRERGVGTDILGFENVDAAEQASVVVCSVPAYHLVDTIESVADALAAGDVLVTPAVGLKRDDDGVHYNRPGAGSVTALAADAAPAGVAVVGAFHNLPAGRLADVDRDLALDTPVVGDDAAVVGTVISLAEEIDGLRAFHAGPIANAAEVEALTPLLINLSTYSDKLDETGVTFH